MSDERKNWLDRVGVIHLWNTIKAALDDKVDKIEGMGLSSNDFTTEEKKKLETLSDPAVASAENNGLMSAADKIKLDGIEKNATHYIHPSYEEKQAGVYRISVDKTGHVATADKMTADELKAEGISPAGHTHDLGELATALDASTEKFEDVDNFVASHTEAPAKDGGEPVTKYYRRTLASLWEWIKSKANAFYPYVENIENTDIGIDDNEQFNMVSIGGTNDESRKTQLAFPYDSINVDSDMYIRTKNGDEWRDWEKIIHSGNIGKQNVATADFASGTLFDKAVWIDLNSSNYDENTWYPVVSTHGIPRSGLHKIKCDVALDSGSKPSQSSHSLGFTVNVEMIVRGGFWGSTGGESICVNNTYSWVTSGQSSPVGYSQMENSSNVVFWLRGGGRYRLYADWDAGWDIKTETYTVNSQSVAPVTSYPGVSYAKATLEGNKYPVGAIYMSVNSTSPANLFGGTQEQLKDRVLIGAGGSYGVNATGGTASVTIGTGNLPAHSAKIQFRDASAASIGLNTFEVMSSSGCSFWREENGGDRWAQKLSCTTSGAIANDALWYSNNGKGTALNNMPPYLGVYIWKRVS